MKINIVSNMIYNNQYALEIEEYVDTNEYFIKKYFKDKSFCISGAAGLIGSYLIDILLETNKKNFGIKIIAIDKNRLLLDERFPGKVEGLQKMYMDVNIDDLPNVKTDFTIHAASNTSPLDYANRPVNTIHTNVIGTDRMIQYSLKHSKRFLFCSSVEMYGCNNGDTDEFREDYSGYVNANTLRAGYPTAKRLSEALCNAYLYENPSWEFVVARIGRVYGPTVINGDSKATTQFILNAVKGEDIVLKSAGTQQFSYGYVGDCATALLYLLALGENGSAYNIADPNSSISLKDFAQAVADAGNVNLVRGEFSESERRGYSKIDKATMNVDKLLALGWTAKFNVNEGVDRTVNYLKTK